MTEPSTREDDRPADGAPDGRSDGARAQDEAPHEDEATFEQLRSLLVGPENEALAELRREIAALRAPVDLDTLSAALPAAIARRRDHDGVLKTELTPVIEAAVHDSVRERPAAFAEAIFPVIGPAIRRSISDAMTRFTEQTSYALDHAFSVQSWRWRLRSLLTGKKLSDVILADSLVYRVEQVFLIHRESGLLLLHAAAMPPETGAPPGDSSPAVADADLVSGMLTAIQDFVRDSFKLEGEEGLRTVQMGDLTVWIEKGPHAVLASVVRGTAPQSLRTSLREVIEACHRDYDEPLRSFSGDTAPFEPFLPHLKQCLCAEYQPPQPPSRVPIWVALALAVAGLTALGVMLVRAHRTSTRWAHAVQTLRDTPGISLLLAETRGGERVLVGLRDPLAPEPERILREAGIPPASVRTRFALYIALEPEFVVRRARSVLRPPETVQLELYGDTLVARGRALPAWRSDAQRLASAIAGVASFADLTTPIAIPPDPAALRRELDARLAEVTGASIFFHANTAAVAAGQEHAVRKLADALRGLARSAAALGQVPEVEIVGLAGHTPEQEARSRLGARRAEALGAQLVQGGIAAALLRTTGQAAGTGHEDSQRAFLRVTLRAQHENGEHGSGDGTER